MKAIVQGIEIKQFNFIESSSDDFKIKDENLDKRNMNQGGKLENSRRVQPNQRLRLR